MKTLVLILSLVAFISLTGKTQTQAKLIAVVNEAEWCGTCQKHGERAMSVLTENNPDGKVLFIMNNVTNDETKKNSEEKLKEYGLDEKMNDHKATGVAYFFNAENNLLVNRISLSRKDQELIEAIQTAIKKVENLE